jgi:L-lactate dehydrogenase complex protein LldG
MRVSPAREEMLAAIRAAIGPESIRVDVPRDYLTAGSLSREEVVERFVERVADYRAAVEVTGEPRVAAAKAFADQRAQRIVVAPDLPSRLRPDGAELVEDDGLSAEALDGFDGALTTSAFACAETGTIALDGGPGQGRRAITLVPDLHVCLVEARRIVETVPELVARLTESAREGRPIVLVSGPSATSDIELNRVEGVHGPRRLVVLVHSAPGA